MLAVSTFFLAAHSTRIFPSCSCCRRMRTLSSTLNRSMRRFDNLFGSPWLNLKVGKFELDNIVSEKRGLTLSASGGGFQLYHFVPLGDNNFVGQIGDNQFGLEWMGHSANDRTRISAAFINSSDGNVDLPGSNSYTGFFAGESGLRTGQTWDPACGLLCHGRTGGDQYADLGRTRISDRGRRVR